MATYNKKPTNPRRYGSSQPSSYQSRPRTEQYSSSVESTGSTPPAPSQAPVRTAAPATPSDPINQLSQQINLLWVLVLAVLAFNMFTYWKMRNIEKNGVTAAGQQQQPAQPAAVQVSADQIKGLFTEDNITFGDKNAKVTFVEFSDPSCPFCHVAAGKNPELNAQVGEQFKLVADGGQYVAPVEEMKKLVDEGKASFVWMYQNGHGNGVLATQALYCAHEKEAFWPAHDKLMTNPGYTLINDTVKNDVANAPQLAEFLADTVDPTFMTECLTSGKYADKVSKDQQTAGTLGVSGTPGFFVNTKNYAGAYSWNDMKADVEAALK